jgi:hypothetical protein
VDQIGKNIKTEVSGDGHCIGQHDGLQGAVGGKLFLILSESLAYVTQEPFNFRR